MNIAAERIDLTESISTNQSHRAGYECGVPTVPTRRPALVEMTNITSVVVVVPAHNEAERIAATIDSVTAARLVSPVPTSLVVVADSCTDSTVAVTRLRLDNRRDQVVECAVRSAGAARRIGVAAALARFDDLSSVWIASTDADTVVPRDWIQEQLGAAARGASAIAGIVTLLQDGDADAALMERFANAYRVSPDGSHEHVHAANLGVRADAYGAVGGWSAIPTGEDHDLWERLQERGFDLIASARLVVATSARRISRAPAGFAADLVALGEHAA